MMGRTIRSRMALASITPVLLVVLTMVAIFWQGRVQDLEDSHQQRVGLLAHQVALFSAYGLFSGNTASLQSVVQQMQQEPGVSAVRVFDMAGNPVASSGHSTIHRFEALTDGSYTIAQARRDVDVRIEIIRPAELPLEDLFSEGVLAQDTKPAALGNAVIEVSRAALNAKKRDALLTAAWVGAIGMLLGGLLAYRLGGWVVGPLVRVSQIVKRIGQGDFSSAAPVPDSDPLQELQASLNQMATRLAWGREELERQVEQVTHELRLKKELAETATQAKSRFLAAASHDLRQPSHALGMFVARLGQLPMDEPMRQLVGHLEDSVQAMQDLLDGLLDLSRLDSGHMPVHMAAVHLNGLLSSARPALESMAEAKGLRLRIRPTPLWALSDARLLQRMLVNLVVNAIRYTEQGTVLVACRPDAGGMGVRLEVWDSGVGIAAEHHEAVFQEFYQLSNRAGDRNVGLGLGLNIVQRSAHLLGHRITLRSAAGCGTRFSIVLDTAMPAQGPQLPADELPLPGAGDLTGLHLLLIEDNPSVRIAVRDLLQSWGCQVWEAATQAQALQHLQEKGVPDIIVSDFRLGMAETGMDAIAALRHTAAHPIAACLMSGDTDEAFLQAVKAAQLPLLHKPVSPAKLRNLLRRLRP